MAPILAPDDARLFAGRNSLPDGLFPDIIYRVSIFSRKKPGLPPPWPTIKEVG
jgi:hypothetical protein